VLGVGDFITGLAKALGNAEVSPRDTQVTIPATILPIVEVQKPLTIASPASVVAARSYMRRDSLVVANSVGTTITCATLLPGLWRLRLSVNYVANYAAANEDVFDARVFLLQSAGIEATIFAHAAFVGRNYKNYELKMNLEKAVQLQFTLSTNGVGQSQYLAVEQSGEKLL